MKITQEMVMELNNELINKGCPFRYEYKKKYSFRKSAYKNYTSEHELCQ